MTLEEIRETVLREITTCAYCAESLKNWEGKIIRGTDSNGVETFLHNACVVAFASKILNEWDRLKPYKPLASAVPKE